MATQDSILAGIILWREEHGGLESIGSQKVRHYWAQIGHKLQQREQNSTEEVCN